MSDNVGDEHSSLQSVTHLGELIPGQIETTVNEDGSITETRLVRAIYTIASDNPTYEEEQFIREKEDAWNRDGWRSWKRDRKAETLGLVNCFPDMDPERKAYFKGGAAKYKKVLTALRDERLTAYLAKKEMGTEWYCPMKAGEGLEEMKIKEAKRDEVRARYEKMIESIIGWMDSKGNLEI